MGRPITWQNVTGPSVAEATRPLALAQQTFNNTFDTLNNLLTKQQEVNQGVVDRERDTNVVAYKEALAKAKTPEEIAALQQSGQLDTFLSALDPSRRNALVGAVDARTGSVQKSILADQEFETKQLQQAQRPLLEQGRAIAATGNIEELNKFAAANPGLVGLGEILEAGAQANREAVKLGFAKNADTRAGTLQADQLQTNATTRALQEQQRLAAIETQNQKNLTAKYDLSKKLQTDAIEKAGLSAGMLNTKEGMETFTSMLKGITTNKSELEDITYNLNKYFPGGMVEIGKDEKGNPIRMPVPVQAALTAIAGSTDSVALIPGWSRRGDDAANRLEAMFKGENRNTEMMKNVLRLYGSNGVKLPDDAELPNLDNIKLPEMPTQAAADEMRASLAAAAAKKGRYIPTDDKKKVLNQ